MRSFTVLPALVAAAAAQKQTFAFGTTGAAATATAPSGPAGTGNACAQVATLVAASGLVNPSIDAEIAYACLKTVPIDITAASDTILSIKQYMEFQSTVAYLKDPPQGYGNAGVDLMGGLDDINTKVKNGDYTNEFDFEADIAMLVSKAHDGHLSFEGMAFSGVFRWRRQKGAALISASSDGKEAPKVWAISDRNVTTGVEVSPVSKIDGKDALQFLKDESENNAYHDADTRYNAMFYMPPAESWGYFTNPRFYPGASLELTYENGTSQTYSNQAVVLDYKAWQRITDGASFYKVFISPSSSAKVKKRDPNSLPRGLEHVKDVELSRRSVPDMYPVPAVNHPSEVNLAGFFIDTSAGTVGVLMVQTFNTNDDQNNDARAFQKLIRDYIAQAQKRNVVKHIIDVRTNGGGKILLGYDMYLQFFPSQEPQLLSRYRGGKAIDLIGSKLSGLQFTAATGNVFTSPFNFHSYLDEKLEAFTDWADMYGPTKFNNDDFTNLLRYNLSEPLSTSSNQYSIGITPNGYENGANKTDPFSADDIVIFTDGICASTCSLFTELMVQQSGVKTIAIGGLPDGGPMQAVGGTKGSLVLQADYLQSVASYVAQKFARSSAEVNDWAEFLPTQFSINHNSAAINFQDNIRKGLEKDGVPTQFLNDSASCRVWYTSSMYLNITETWSKIAEVAFGKDGGMDEDACISGSVTSKEAQQGQGEGNPNPTSPGGNGNTAGTTPTPSGSKAAAASIGRPSGGWTAVLVCAGVVGSSMLFGASLI